MSLRKRLTILAGVAVASVAVITATSGSVALASTPTGTQIKSNRTSECVTAQLSGAGIVQDTCQNSAGQNWTFLGDTSNGNPFQLENLDTGLCADIQSFSNAAPVVQVPCGQQQIGAYWKYVPAGSREFPFVNLFHLQSPFANYCLDLENGLNTIGLSMQVWQCNFNTNNQIWYIF